MKYQGNDCLGNDRLVEMTAGRMAASGNDRSGELVAQGKWPFVGNDHLGEMTARRMTARENDRSGGMTAQGK